MNYLTRETLERHQVEEDVIEECLNIFGDNFELNDFTWNRVTQQNELEDVLLYGWYYINDAVGDYSRNVDKLEEATQVIWDLLRDTPDGKYLTDKMAWIENMIKVDLMYKQLRDQPEHTALEDIEPLSFKVTEHGINGGISLSISSAEELLLKSVQNDDDFGSDDFMYRLFENFIANSEYDWIQPEEVGALTSAPMLGVRDEAGNITHAYGFMDYQVRSAQEVLVANGSVFFAGGETVPYV